MVVTVNQLDLHLRMHSVTTANKRCEFDARPLRDILDTALTFVSDLRFVGYCFSPRYFAFFHA